MLITERYLPVLESDVIGGGVTIQEQLWRNLTTICTPHRTMTSALGIDGNPSLSATALALRELTPRQGYNSIFLLAEVDDSKPDAFYVAPWIGNKLDIQGYRGQPINIQPYGLDLDKVTRDPLKQAASAEAIWEGVNKDGIVRRFLDVFEQTAKRNIDNIPAEREAQAVRRGKWAESFPSIPCVGTDFVKWKKTMRGVLSFVERLRGDIEKGTVIRELMPRSATLKYIPA